MIRQRVNLRRAPWALLTRTLTVIFALLLIYGGVLTALLALKVGPGSIERISDYQRVYHWVAHLNRGAFSTAVSLIAGFGGLIVFLLFIFLASQTLPRPYFARTDMGLESTGGATLVRPRAVERIAEVAARRNPHVIGVTGRLGDEELSVDVGLDDAGTVRAVLGEVRSRVAEELERHHLPVMPVNVTLTGYEPTRRDHP